MRDRHPFPDWHPDAQLAPYIDYTVATADAGAREIASRCEEAAAFGFRSVCVNGGWVRLCRERLGGTGVKVSAAVGFPLGAQATRAKAFEAGAALDDGASEIDMVMAIGKLKDGDRDAVERDIAAVVLAVQGGALVKVVLETGLLTDEEKRLAARIAEAAGADCVQTSTGFAGSGANAGDVALLRGELSARMGVKAAGGIRTADAAIALLRAGAGRIGSSAGVAIVSGI
ncbi:deoxyribose-phosphate aldolase [Cohnella suwonensis]|uniref:Deoxyribose-phosphate aldolase n=1 Tax=Cohnella suwonensis TaxID=696072 RepID=A0ABW0LQX7_9BACL